jgi:L-ascorbate metabolism protein UlaG (beta-lactamase superfamily)
MKISYFGHSNFLVEGKDYSILLDPFSNVGLKEVKNKCDYVFCSHNHFDHNNKSLAIGAKEVKNGYPFEIIKTYHDEKEGLLRGENNVLLFDLDGFKLAFLGDLGEYDNEELIKKLFGVDFLFVPVGGKYTIDEVGAFNYVKKINPKVVIPMHYKLKNSTVDIKGVEYFLNKFKSYIEVSSPYVFSNESGVVLIKEE